MKLLALLLLAGTIGHAQTLQDFKNSTVCGTDKRDMYCYGASDFVLGPSVSTLYGGGATPWLVMKMTDRGHMIAALLPGPSPHGFEVFNAKGETILSCETDKEKHFTGCALGPNATLDEVMGRIAMAIFSTY